MTKYNENGTYQKEVSVDYQVIDFDKESHYVFIKEWWCKYYYADPPPESCVPRHGVIALFKGKPVASAFLYINETKLCHLDFCMVDPNMGAGRRVFFLRHIVDAGIKKAKQILGDEAVIWSLTDHAVVGRIYQEKGFKCLGEGDCFAYTESATNVKFLE